MKIKHSILLTVLAGGIGLVAAGLAWAHSPYEEVSSDDPVYQGVKHLETYGLLDPTDQQVLDQGKIVTRMELAFYTEKAKARIEAPALGSAAPPTPVPAVAVATPVPAVQVPSEFEVPPPVIPAAPTATPVPVLPPPTIPEPMATTAPVTTPVAPIAPPEITPVAAPTLAPSYPPAAKAEIEKLLKELDDSTQILRSHLALEDERLKDREAELESLKKVQDDVDSVWKKANHSVGIPNFNTNTNVRFENINLSGIAQESATKILQEAWVGMYTDMGGIGTLSTGFGMILPFDNYSAEIQVAGVGTAPASIYLGNPSATFHLYGDLGKWDTTFAVECYQPDTTFGALSRGYANNAIKRFEDPFDIKNFNDDKNAKNWDDYMTSVSYIPAYSATAGNVQSASDRVFDGMYTVGRQLPWLGPDGRMWFLVGRMGETPTQTQRWEEGLKIDEPWANSLVRTAFSAEWVNDNFGIVQPLEPSLDMKDYEADVHLNLNAVQVDFDGAFSHFYTGTQVAGPVYTNIGATLPDPNPIESGAGLASVAIYPFTVYGFAIGDTYADFQSKVTMSGLNFFHYGLSFNPSDYQDVYGSIGEADNLQSDRYGWRFNFGWNGRKQDFMKKWPSFLDAIVINFDVAQKSEYVSEQDPMGYNTLEPVQILSFYYPDDEGLWGLDMWGNYAPNVNPVRQDYINNIEALRNDGDISNDDVRYQFRMTSERLPLVLPIYNNGGALSLTPANPGQLPAKYPDGLSKGFNEYANIQDLKSYNYITLTTKIKAGDWMGTPGPVDLSFFMTVNQVSSSSSAATFFLNPATAGGSTTIPSPGSPSSSSPSIYSTNIPDLFTQQVYEGAIMINIIKDFDLMGDIGVETWESNYTYPLVNYQTNEYGLGFGWDIPWGGGKMEWRYKHIDFADLYVPVNNYSGDQFFSKIKFMF